MELVFSSPVCHQGVVLTRNGTSPNPENKRQKSQKSKRGGPTLKLNNHPWDDQASAVPISCFRKLEIVKGPLSLLFVYIFLPFQKECSAPSDQHNDRQQIIRSKWANFPHSIELWVPSKVIFGGRRVERGSVWQSSHKAGAKPSPGLWKSIKVPG